MDANESTAPLPQAEGEKDDELHRARVHMQFVCRMYKLQHKEGRYFFCMNTVKVRCHGQKKIASKKFRR